MFNPWRKIKIQEQGIIYCFKNWQILVIFFVEFQKDDCCLVLITEANIL